MGNEHGAPVLDQELLLLSEGVHRAKKREHAFSMIQRGNGWQTNAHTLMRVFPHFTYEQLRMVWGVFDPAPSRLSFCIQELFVAMLLMSRKCTFTEKVTAMFDMFNVDDDFRLSFGPFETLVSTSIVAGCKLLRLPPPDHQKLQCFITELAIIGTQIPLSLARAIASDITDGSAAPPAAPTTFRPAGAADADDVFADGPSLLVRQLSGGSPVNGVGRGATALSGATPGQVLAATRAVARPYSSYLSPSDPAALMAAALEAPAAPHVRRAAAENYCSVSQQQLQVLVLLHPFLRYPVLQWGAVANEQFLLDRVHDATLRPLWAALVTGLPARFSLPTAPVVTHSFQRTSYSEGSARSSAHTSSDSVAGGDDDETLGKPIVPATSAQARHLTAGARADRDRRTTYGINPNAHGLRFSATRLDHRRRLAAAYRTFRALDPERKGFITVESLAGSGHASVHDPDDGVSAATAPLSTLSRISDNRITLPQLLKMYFPSAGPLDVERMLALTSPPRLTLALMQQMRDAFVLWAQDLALPAHMRGSGSATVADLKAAWLAECQQQYMSEVLGIAGRTGASNVATASTVQLVAKSAAARVHTQSFPGRSPSLLKEGIDRPLVVAHGGVVVQCRQEMLRLFQADERFVAAVSNARCTANKPATFKEFLYDLFNARYHGQINAFLGEIEAMDLTSQRHGSYGVQSHAASRPGRAQLSGDIGAEAAAMYAGLELEQEDDQLQSKVGSASARALLSSRPSMLVGSSVMENAALTRRLGSSVVDSRVRITGFTGPPTARVARQDPLAGLAILHGPGTAAGLDCILAARENPTLGPMPADARRLAQTWGAHETRAKSSSQF